jgi:hypothetical protein
MRSVPASNFHGAFPLLQVRFRPIFGVRRLAAALTAKTHFMRKAIPRSFSFFALIAVLFAALYLPRTARTDQPSYDTVGSIEGEAITVQGAMNIEVVQGHTRTILRSGSDVHVNSGQARIELVEGGQIAVCGPAHFSVLKSVNLLTVALDSGIIHAHIPGAQPALTIYTAQLQAKPLAISDAPQDTVIGLDPAGAMCIRADSGAVRVEQQLTAQSIIVPQNGEVLISNGQLDSVRTGVTHCACELQIAKTQTSPAPQTEITRLPTPEEMQKANAELARHNAESPKTSSEASNSVAAIANTEAPKPNTDAAKANAETVKPATESAKSNSEVAKPSSNGAKAPASPAQPAAKDGPVYQVFMPPLSYDAKAKVQPDNFDPQLIVLVRRVRVRPTLVFQGTVKNAPVVAAKPAPAAPQRATEAPAPQKQQAPQKAPQSSPSIIDRIRAFFHRLFS